MTDSPDRDEADEFPESTGDDGVPRDVGWELVSQEHVDLEAPDDLTVTIVQAVAEAEDVSPTAVLDPPLYDSVDPVEVESTLFGDDVGPDAGSVEFMYRGFRVVVRRDGWVLVYEPVEP